jgi:uncharacterized flavoprotein (TIGR03862 family)
MNITHSEDLPSFAGRYGNREKNIAPLLNTFTPDALREWIHTLGIDTFVGSSGRVFPREMKAAPLLRAWLHRLREAGVTFHMRHRWLGWAENNTLRFAVPDAENAKKTDKSEKLVQADAVILALGGGSWAHLGSDGLWIPLLTQRGIAVAPLKPANCGFDTNWSKHFSSRFAGEPVKTVVLSYTDQAGIQHSKQGEIMITATGVEGGLIYALSAGLRDQIAQNGNVQIYLDLLPSKDQQVVINEIAHPRGSRSMSSHLQSRLGFKGVKAGLLRELVGAEVYADPKRLGAAIKHLPLTLVAPRPLNEAISSAGGVEFEALDEQLMIRKLPGVFCAGEMLDWEAPTGGYLLTACFASGKTAGHGALNWLKSST